MSHTLTLTRKQLQMISSALDRYEAYCQDSDYADFDHPSDAQRARVDEIIDSAGDAVINSLTATPPRAPLSTCPQCGDTMTHSDWQGYAQGETEDYTVTRYRCEPCRIYVEHRFTYQTTTIDT